MHRTSVCQKLRYLSQVDALVALKAMELRIAAASVSSVEIRGGYAPVRAYRCFDCTWWHLTSQPPRKLK